MIPGIGKGDVEVAEQRASAGHAQVLIVDESLPVRAKMMEILTKLGTPADQILQATTPEEALDAFRAHRPGVIFVELVGVHPEDGLEVIHEMLEIDPRARIVLVTAESRETAEVRAAIRAGVFAYVEKPLRHEKIRSIIAELEAEEGGIERYR